MISLKNYLNHKVSRFITFLGFISWIILFVILICVGIISGQASLKENLRKTSVSVTSMAYSKDWRQINEFLGMGLSSKTFSQVRVVERHSGIVLYQSNRSNDIFPQICGVDKDSELLLVEGCTEILSKEILIILTSLTLFFITLSYLIYRLMYAKVISSFNLISQEIIDSLNESNTPKNDSTIFEINEIKMKLKDQTRIIEESGRKAAFVDLSRRVVHDLRSPLGTIMNISKKNEISDSEKEVLKSSSRLLNEIANNLLLSSSQKKKLNRRMRISLNELIQEVVAVKRIEYEGRDLKIKIDAQVEQNIWMNRESIERVFSNLINNSLEALDSIEISIRIQDFNSGVLVTFTDNGPGFSQEVLDKFNNSDDVTTKTKGTGIGLKSSRLLIENCDGRFSILNHSGGGAQVEIFFSRESCISKDLPLILIDDDKYVHLSWKGIAEQKGFSLISFRDYGSFITSLASLNKESEVFLDIHLGEGVSGKDYVDEIFSLGFPRINLATGYREEEFDVPPNINNVITKEFPY